MNAQTLDVDVHRERSGYWAQVRDAEGCLAAGETLDELLQVLHDAVATYFGEAAPERILTRVTALRLEVQPDLRPRTVDSGPLSRRAPQRRSHPDDS